MTYSNSYGFSIYPDANQRKLLIACLFQNKTRAIVPFAFKANALALPNVILELKSVVLGLCVFPLAPNESFKHSVLVGHVFGL